MPAASRARTSHRPYYDTQQPAKWSVHSRGDGLSSPCWGCDLPKALLGKFRMIYASSIPSSHNHLETIFGSQAYTRIGYDLLSWYQFKGDAPGQGCEEQVTFHHGKVIADADAGTSTEGQISVARQSLLVFWGEALRVKLFWAGEEVGPAVERIGCDEHCVNLAYQVAIDLDIVQYSS